MCNKYSSLSKACAVPDKGFILKKRKRFVFILSPGSQPEILELALALQSREIPFRFFTSGVISKESYLFKTLDFFVHLFVSEKLSKRTSDIKKTNVRNIGLIIELLISIANENFRSHLIKFRNWWYAFRVIPLVVILRPKLVIAQAHSNSFPIFIAKKLGIPTLLNVSIAHHDWMLEEFKTEKRLNPEWGDFLQHDSVERYERQHLNREIENADYVLASSSFTVKTFEEYILGAKEFFVVPLGFDSSKFHQALDLNNRNGILYIGQLTQRKGISYLIKAYSEFSPLGDSKLTIIGRDTGEMHSKLHLLQNVSVESHMNHDELSVQMKRSKIFVLPSLAEGFALSALEAMASGLVVIVSDRTFAADIISDGVDGYIVNPRDCSRIAEILELIDNDKELASMVSRNAVNTASKFTWAEYRAKVALVIEEILAKT